MKKGNLLMLLSALVFMSMGRIGSGQITTLPVIDGDGSDAAWTAATIFELKAIISLPSTSNDQDFSGYVKFLWSADSLYFFIEVKDDILYDAASQNFMNDNFVLNLDLYNKKTPEYIDTTQMFWEVYWFDAPYGGRRGPDWGTPVHPLHLEKTVNEGTGYTAEIAVAWSLLGLAPSAGDILGTDIKINDHDGEAEEGAGRNQLAWSDRNDLGWDQPWVFGTMQLQEDGTVEALANEITLDGMLDGGMAYLQSQAISAVINVSTVSDEDDFSGNFRGKWDEDNFYLFVEVKDDILYSGSTNAFENDNFVIYLDLNNQKTETYVDNTQMYWEIYWYDKAPAGRLGPNWGTLPSLQLAKDVNEGTGYSAEIIIPWSNLNYTPAVGAKIGFDLKINDNDGAGRDLISWYDRTDNTWDNPSLFGTIELAENDILWLGEYVPSGSQAVTANDVMVYPIPARNYITIDSDYKIESVNIYSLAGKRILSISDGVEAGSEIDVSGLPNGFYILLIDVNNETRKYKILKY